LAGFFSNSDILNFEIDHNFDHNCE